ncbi:MAG: response regulator [Saprospiraceae bacterium]
MRKILIIEDNQDIRDNLEEILELQDYVVHLAENGEKGIASIQEIKPDLILCDVAMPQKNGYEVLDHVRSNPLTVATPFIFITASAEERDIAMGKMAGADDYLAKPFPSSKLIASISRLLNEDRE